MRLIQLAAVATLLLLAVAAHHDKTPHCGVGSIEQRLTNCDPATQEAWIDPVAGATRR